MHSVVLIARIVLAGTFGVAGTAKLADLPSSRQTMVTFGLPESAGNVAGTLLPFVELAVALALLLAPSARWAGVGAAALLLIFASGISYALSHGRTPECNCFGQVSSQQISWRTLARNGVLLLVAGLVIWRGPGSSLSAWTTDLAAANLVAGLATLAAVALAVVALRYRELAATASRTAAAEAFDPPPGLSPGEAAPAFELERLTGGLVTLDSLREPGRPVVLVFASPVCGPCTALLPELARWSGALSHRITFAVIESAVDERAEVHALFPASDHLVALTEAGQEIASAYQVSATPTAVAVDPSGRIAVPYALGGPSIEQLVRAVLAGSERLSPAA